MRIHLRRALVAAVAIAATGMLVPAAPAGAATNDSSVPCLHAIAGSGGSSWTGQTVTQSTTTSGKGKKAVTQTTYTLGGNGTFDTSYQLGVTGPTGSPVPAASCIGADYSFHIWTSPSFNLNWATTLATPNGSTTVSADGSDVVLHLAGDGVTSMPHVTATTAGTYTGSVPPCVSSQATITYNNSVVAQSNVLTICIPDAGGGGGYF